MSRVLGKTVRKPVSEFDTFPAPGDMYIEFETDELTSSCPVTGQPDFYRLKITYRAQKKCIESKSLKLYLWQFRDTAQFGEALAQRICDDIVSQIEPERCVVELNMKARGGITMKVVVHG